MANTALFDGMAHRYDQADRIRIAQRIAAEIRATLPGEVHGTAMDFGCGTGLVGLELMDVFDQMIFIDSAQGMLEVVREKLRILGREAECLQLDLEAGETTEQRADCILLVQVLLHIPDIQPFLAQLKKLLNPGGRLILVDFDGAPDIVSDLVHPGFSQAELAGSLTSLGFSKVNSHTFYYGEKIFMGQNASLFLMEAVKV